MQHGTITQAILSDPATVLNNVNKQLTIANTLTWNVTTNGIAPLSGRPSPDPYVTEGGGTANIAFLVGTAPDVPNANAIAMDATFWIETVKSTITIPVSTPYTKLCLQPAFTPLDGIPPPPLPTFEVTPTQPVTQPIVVDVTYTQIQYAQLVFLQFGGLVWPHASVATLVPAAPIVVSVPAQ
jgi:hypothetical protein